jgi:oligoribonuclease NrnB/cAMP/cGMP phosphodiesterase (DHH superfamily)
MDGKTVVIYHAPCADGFTAAWIFREAYRHAMRQEPTFIGAQYGDDPPIEACRGAEVFVVDFCYPLEALTDLSYVARSVHVLDHHRTAAPIVHDWADRCGNARVSFDEDRSGARLAWDYCRRLPGREGTMPALVSYVEDRDLWRHRLPATRAINAVVQVTEQRWDRWTDLADKLDHTQRRLTVVAQGQALLEAAERQIEAALKTAFMVRLYVDDRELDVPAVNSQVHISELGHRLAQRSYEDIGAVVSIRDIDSGLALVVSLRAVGEAEVHEVAACYGGGGHPKAAGFVAPMTRVEALPAIDGLLIRPKK